MISVDILVPKCTSGWNLEESADLLDADFREITMPLMSNTILDKIVTFDKRDTLRLVGGEDGKINSVLLIRYGERSSYDKVWLIRFFVSGVSHHGCCTRTQDHGRSMGV